MHKDRMQTHPGEGEEAGKVTWDLQGRRTNSAVGEDITHGEIFEIKLDRQIRDSQLEKDRS